MREAGLTRKVMYPVISFCFFILLLVDGLAVFLYVCLRQLYDTVSLGCHYFCSLLLCTLFLSPSLSLLPLPVYVSSRLTPRSRRVHEWELYTQNSEIARLSNMSRNLLRRLLISPVGMNVCSCVSTFTSKSCWKGPSLLLSLVLASSVFFFIFSFDLSTLQHLPVFFTFLHRVFPFCFPGYAHFVATAGIPEGSVYDEANHHHPHHLLMMYRCASCSVRNAVLQDHVHIYRRCSVPSPPISPTSCGPAPRHNSGYPTLSLSSDACYTLTSARWRAHHR